MTRVAISRSWPTSPGDETKMRSLRAVISRHSPLAREPTSVPSAAQTPRDLMDYWHKGDKRGATGDDLLDSLRLVLIPRRAEDVQRPGRPLHGRGAVLDA